MEQVRLSPTSTSCFKRCPSEYRLRYVEGIVPLVTADPLRVGTNWHEMMERYQIALALATDPDRDAAFATVIDWLNETYATVPTHKTTAEWLEERTVLATLFAGYHWYYADDTFETLATEQKYELPLIEPRSGMPLPTDEVIRVGKIDRIVNWNGRRYVMEYKTTSRNLDGDSDYWRQWIKDTQFSSYVAACRDMGNDCSGVLLDVVKKPTISMKALSQKATAELIETGEYFGTKFDIGPVQDEAEHIEVDDVFTEIEWGKSGKPAIRETPEMFGARLLADIYENPEKYFARKEVPRTDDMIAEYKRQLYAVYRAIRTMMDTGCWYQNERASEPGYKSEYAPLLELNSIEQFCDGETTPDGFKRYERRHATTAIQ